MMPLMVFLLQSEDMKKQADRIIQEVRTNGIKEFVPGKDVEKTNNEFMRVLSDLTNNIDKLRTDLKDLSERLPDKKDSAVTIDKPAYAD